MTEAISLESTSSRPSLRNVLGSKNKHDVTCMISANRDTVYREAVAGSHITVAYQALASPVSNQRGCHEGYYNGAVSIKRRARSAQHRVLVDMPCARTLLKVPTNT